MRLAFGEFLPDQPGVVGALTKAENVVSKAVGYSPFPSPVDYSLNASEDLTSLFAARGGGSQAYLLAGSESELYLLDNISLNVVSNPSGYSGNEEARWNFVQFGTDIIAANGQQELQKYNLGTSTTFENIVDSPAAKYIAVVRDFVVSGYQTANPFRVQWSGINDANTWTFNQVTQSDFQDIPDSGAVQGITGGEFGVVFLEKSIYRMSYVGTPVIFQFDEIIRGLGCAEPNSIVQYQNLTFFLADDGFYTCDGQTVKAIGAEKVDRYFLDDFDSDYGYKMSATVDPIRNVVIWAYPSSRGAGNVDSLIIYNFNTQKWTTGTTDVRFVGISQTPGVTLEQLDTINNNLDNLGTSLDSRLWVGGKFELAGGRGAKIITFTGSPMMATINSGDIEIENRFSNLRLVRPIIDGGTANVALASRARLRDDVTYGAYQTPSSEDRVSVRGSGRYHRLSFQPTGLWQTAIGADIEIEQQGGR
jgi:hypothetical protein